MASRMHRMSAHIWAASQTDLLEGRQARRQRKGRAGRGKAGLAHLLAIICVHHKLPGLCDAPPIFQRCKIGEGEQGDRRPCATLCSCTASQPGMAAPSGCCSPENIALPQRLLSCLLVLSPKLSNPVNQLMKAPHRQPGSHLGTCGTRRRHQGTPAQPAPRARRCCRPPGSGARWWGTAAPAAAAAGGSGSGSGSGSGQQLGVGLCQLDKPCGRPAWQHWHTVGRHNRSTCIWDRTCSRARSRKARLSKPSAPRIACCTRLASFLFSPESNTRQRRRALPRMRAALRPAGPPPAHRECCC